MTFNNYILADLTSLIIDYRGKTPKKLNGDWAESGYRALSAKNIKTGNIVQKETIRFLDFHMYKKWMKDEIIRGDILITSEAPFGEVFYWDSDEKIVLSQRLFALRVKSDVNPKYVYYYMQTDHFRAEMDGRATGTTVRGLRQPELLRCSIRIPKIKYQNSIANILSSLDGKIELNNRINKNLEEIAQTLYKRWFIDFEFPNEEGIPYKSSGGEMVESELGLIPKGWEVKSVTELFDFIGGSQPPKSEHIYEARKGYVRFIQNRDFQGNPKHLTFIEESNKNKLANELDILIDKYGEVGKIRYGISGAYNVALAKISPKIYEDRELLRGYFNQSSIKIYLENSSIASTRGSLNGTTFTGLKIPYPVSLIKKTFFEIKTNILQSILKRKKENANLTNLRNLLLPKLMNGEIEVPFGDDHGA